MRASLPAYPLACPPTGRPASVPHSGAHPRSCPPGGSQSPQSQSGASPKPGGTGRRCTGLLARGVGGRQTVSQLECLSSSGMQGSSRQGAQRQPRKPAGKPAGKPASKPAGQPASQHSSGTSAAQHPGRSKQPPLTAPVLFVQAAGGGHVFQANRVEVELAQVPLRAGRGAAGKDGSEEGGSREEGRGGRASAAAGRSAAQGRG